MLQGCHARIIDPYGGPIGPRLLGDPHALQTFRVAYDSGDHVHPSDAGYDATAPAVNLTFFQSNEVKRDEQAHSLWQAPDSMVSKESGTKHFLRITKNAWIVAQFQCEFTFIPHIADCDYAQHSLKTGVLLR
jgi:hypothetical protein